MSAAEFEKEWVVLDRSKRHAILSGGRMGPLVRSGIRIGYIEGLPSDDERGRGKVRFSGTGSADAR